MDSLNGVKLIDLENVRIAIIYGYINYVEVIESIQSSAIPQIRSQVNEKQSPEGGYVLLLQQFNPEDPSKSEGKIKEQIQIIAGLLAALLGQNIVYKSFFDNIVELKSNKRTVFSSSYRNPLTLSGPDVDNQRLQFLKKAHKAMLELPEFEKNRVELSLRWYFESLQSDGVDIFLKNWFALEALGMSEKENIKPLNKSLADAYGMPFAEVRTRFQVGKIYSFRNRMVHRGEIFPIHANLSDYVEAIYLDVLSVHLGIPCEMKAEQAMSKSNFDLDQLIYLKKNAH